MTILAVNGNLFSVLTDRLPSILWSGCALSEHEELYLQFNPLQFEYRYRIDSRLDSAISDQRIYDPSVEVKLAPFYLGLPKGKFATIEDTPNLSLAVKTWWINGRQWEGRYEMRLRVPVHVWFVTSAGISIRHGADEDNNFLSDNSIGFDVGIRRP